MLPASLRKEIEEATRLIDVDQESHMSLSKKFNVEVTAIYEIHHERLARDELKDLDGEIGKRRKERDALDGEIAERREEVQRLNRERESVKEAFETQGLSWKEGVVLVAEISNLREEKIGLEKELPTLRVETKRGRSTFRRLKAKLTDLRGCIKREEREFRILLGRIMSARDRLYAKRVDFQVEVKRMEEHKAALTSANQKLEERNKELKELRSELRGETKTLREEMRGLKTEVKREEKRRARIKEECGKLVEATSRRAKMIVEGAEQKREKMLKQVEDLKKEKRILEAEIGLVRALLKDDIRKVRKKPREIRMHLSAEQFKALEKIAPLGDVEALIREQTTDLACNATLGSLSHLPKLPPLTVKKKKRAKISS